MSRKKEYCSPVRISQEENGFTLELGWTNCSGETERYVFQSFTELVNHLNEHFTFRNESIYADFNAQLNIILKQ
jgi:hypothetical protein